VFGGDLCDVSSSAFEAARERARTDRHAAHTLHTISRGFLGSRVVSYMDAAMYLQIRLATHRVLDLSIAHVVHRPCDSALCARTNCRPCNSTLHSIRALCMAANHSPQCGTSAQYVEWHLTSHMCDFDMRGMACETCIPRRAACMSGPHQWYVDTTILHPI